MGCGGLALVLALAHVHECWFDGIRSLMEFDENSLATTVGLRHLDHSPVLAMTAGKQDMVNSASSSVIVRERHKTSVVEISNVPVKPKCNCSRIGDAQLVLQRMLQSNPAGAMGALLSVVSAKQTVLHARRRGSPPDHATCHTQRIAQENTNDVSPASRCPQLTCHSQRESAAKTPQLCQRGTGTCCRTLRCLRPTAPPSCCRLPWAQTGPVLTTG